MSEEGQEALVEMVVVDRKHCLSAFLEFHERRKLCSLFVTLKRKQKTTTIMNAKEIVYTFYSLEGNFSLHMDSCCYQKLEKNNLMILQTS